jgi:hypothetical protein
MVDYLLHWEEVNCRGGTANYVLNGTATVSQLLSACASHSAVSMQGLQSRHCQHVALLRSKWSGGLAKTGFIWVAGRVRATS